MKRFMKGCAITALIFGVIGVVFVMVGGAAAGSAAIYRTVEETTKGRVRLDGWWGMYPYGGLKSWIFGWMASEYRMWITVMEAAAGWMGMMRDMWLNFPTAAKYTRGMWTNSVRERISEIWR